MKNVTGDLDQKLIPKGNTRRRFEDGSKCTRCCFWHLTKVIVAGNKEDYDFKDLFECEEKILYADFHNFKKFFDTNPKKFQGKFFEGLINYTKKTVRKTTYLYILTYILEMSFPVILKALLDWIELTEFEMTEGYLYAALISFCIFMRSFVVLHADYSTEYTNAIIRNATRSMIVHKVSSLAPGARKYVDIGKVANHILVDINKVREYMIFRHHIFLVPFALLFYLFLIVRSVGNLGFSVIGIFAISLLIQTRIDKVFQKANFERMTISDKRGRKINEIITGAKIIKFNAWEKIMNNLIRSYRAQEGNLIFKAFGLYNLSHAISSMIPTLLGLVIFMLYDKPLSVSQIYELVTLFNATLVPIRYYIMAIMGLADVKAAEERINNLMSIEPTKPLGNDQNLPVGALEIQNGNFNWEDPKYYQLYEGKKINKETQHTYILKNINIRINQGDFVAIVGKVGSGKSSLMLALMDEMVRQSGQVKKNGAVAYISQETFLQCETIENNILFGKPFNKQKLKDTLEICQMMPDLDILPGREKTEIGERGINMSGGQKQRINIARAVYSEADIYLIDDALSALDAHVGKKIMNQVFINKLRGKTRIMVTHYLHLLNEVDKVVLIDEGEIKAFGSFDIIKNSPAFIAFAKNSEKAAEDPKPEDEEEEQIETELKKDDQEENWENEETEELEVAEEVEEEQVDVKQKVEEKMNDEDYENAGKLMQEEKKNSGSIGVGYYGYYLRSAGTCLSIMTVFFFAMSITLKMAGDWWVGQWQENAYDLEKKVYLQVFGVIGACTFVFLGFRAVFLGAVSKLAAVNIFKSIIWNILRRPMSFFDTTPSGVIINRCTNDVSHLDFEIPWMMSFFLTMGFNFVGALVLASVVSPTIIIFILFAFLLIVSSFKKFMKMTIELKRLVQVSMSPVLSISSELIEGATVIRLYRQNQAIVDKFRVKADIHHEACFHDSITVIWIRKKLEFSLAMIVMLNIFSVVISRQIQLVTITDPSTSGLIISYMLPLSQMTASLIYPMIFLTKSAVSIQRLYQYAKWKHHEKPFFTPKAPANWPNSGEIYVHNLSVRYRKGLPLVLKGVTFKVQPGEKVGIIGRTGSGKSTALLTFMRILEMAAYDNGQPMGYISIDGQRIDEIGLHELRGKISIIPQDPFLLEGTLRFNLDPDTRYEDEELISILKSVSVFDTIKLEDIVNQKYKKLKEKMKKKIEKMPEKEKKRLTKGFKDVDTYVNSTVKMDDDPILKRLNSKGLEEADKLSLELEQGGTNLSIGQRQLVCIARALIKQPKILLMDEATANIDQKTDSIIQKLIKETLKNTTVMTIAHRLITIVQYDKIVILEKGVKIEEGSPAELLEDGESFFTKMVAEGGKEFVEKMKLAANDRSLDPAALFAN